MLPNGAFTVIGRLQPSLKGMSGAVSTDFAHESAEARVEANGQLMLVATCGSVPSKSTVSVSPSMVTVQRIQTGSSPTPSSSMAAWP